MQVIISSPPPQQMAVSLDSLLNPNVPDGVCPRRVRQQIDLVLLAIEALDLGGSEAILWSSKELGLQDIIKNRVVAWKLRATNPMRRNSQRQPLSLTEAKALVLIICHLAEQLATVVRQLLLAYEQLTEKQLSLDHSPRLANYLERFRAHFRSRMNPKRSTVMTYDDEKLNQLALNLLSQLLFCTGTAGTQRLWNSLFDGEVA
ncbi:MAG: DUF3038 domain-containing protein [Drouetiella hepatica Uher 2000/2452]|uniref:DUF3038 domain-containing protein n=1 Tax=Drouetiella hepatica Uher 2000/2452 TaxID=904376 RepID=A0A951QE77_9CYAN|nr:DUF3038 domain-containing protein [Drouetiella hepatica Uher 2000/2452]